MRFEYAMTIKEQIAREHDKAKLHGRRIECVWLTEDEWDEFFASMNVAERLSNSDPDCAMWDGVKINVVRIHSGGA